jgi:hypothetical protein
LPASTNLPAIPTSDNDISASAGEEDDPRFEIARHARARDHVADAVVRIRAARMLQAMAGSDA